MMSHYKLRPTGPLLTIKPLPADQKLSVLRKAVLYGLTLLLVYGVLEAASWIAYAIVSDDSFSFAALQARRTRVIRMPSEAIRSDSAAANSPRYLGREAIHPYLGFVRDPTSDQRANKYGFLGPPPRVDCTRESSDTIFVAVLGGSVSAVMLRNAQETLLRDLRGAKPFAGKQIIVTNLAMGGQKQPQQLMIVNYFLSLGACFDLVINLDGFNDMVLPIVENTKLGTNPFYPRAWKYRVAGLADQDLLRKVGHVAYLEGVRYDVARFFSRTPVKYSVTANVFWDQLDLGLWKTVKQKRVALTQEVLDRDGDKQQDASFTETGPSRTYASEEARYRDQAAYWKRSSMLLNNLARGSGFHYFHFLQPNQHVPGSKIFSEEELAIAFPDPPHPYAKTAREGYPYLIEAGKELVEEGVNYTDLTMIFAGNGEVLYRDGCCHFKKRGYELIAREIARVIKENLDGR